MLLGLLSLESELDVASIFSDNNAGVDQFIKAALAQSQKLKAEDKSTIHWNPPRESVIQANDHAIYMERGYDDRA